MDRPENIPEQFWNAEAGAVNTEALLGAYADATKPMARPDKLPDQFWDPDNNRIKLEDLVGAVQPKAEPTAEERAAATKALAEGYGEFTLPEGFKLDAEQFAPVRDMFAELGLNKEGAQRLLDSYAANVAGVAKQIEAADAQAWKDIHTAWNTEIEKDEKFGGAKLAESRAAITKLTDRFGTPELKAAFDLTGADKNPAVFRFLAGVANVLTEGKYFEGRPASAAPKSQAERLYPNGGNTNIGGQPPKGANE